MNDKAAPIPIIGHPLCFHIAVFLFLTLQQRPCDAQLCNVLQMAVLSYEVINHERIDMGESRPQFVAFARCGRELFGETLTTIWRHFRKMSFDKIWASLHSEKILRGRMK